jgi:xylose isomerase
MNPGGGRFYAPNRIYLPTTAKLDLIASDCRGVTHVEAHDTDVLDLVLPGQHAYPATMREEEKLETAIEAAKRLRAELHKRGLKPGMWTMNLFSSDPLFNFGNLGSEVTNARDLAIRRTIVGMQIANEILACLYVYWNGTNGVDGLISANHAKRIMLTYLALVTIISEVHAKYGENTLPAAGEAKPEEPKSRMYTPVTQSFLAMAMRLELEHPELAGLFGVNPEVGHEVMAKLDPAMTYGEAMMYGLLYHCHLNDQGGDPGFDRDHPAGSMCPKGLLDIVWQLKVNGYTGLLGIDAQPRATDSDSQQHATIKSSARRIRWAVEAAKRVDDAVLLDLQSRHDQAEIDNYIDTVVFQMAE